MSPGAISPPCGSFAIGCGRTARPGVSLDELSMGMSGDFEVAIEEGATIVRVGSALFEGIVDSPLPSGESNERTTLPLGEL